MKKKSSTIVVVVILLAGLSLLLYPTVSNYWNSCHQTRAISNYVEKVNSLDKKEYERIWDEAREYNKYIATHDGAFIPDNAEKANYNSVLNVDGSGIMGYIEIETIDVHLPIYHGTEDTVLSEAAGHIEWSFLPVGGEGTHCVLSGHRGLPGAKLFTNLDKMQVKDTFVIRVLNETLTYEVEKILTVEPTDTAALRAEKGKDYCTLVTCTPYGINTHRLLVRGHRVANADESRNVRITSTAVQVKPTIVASFIAVPLSAIMLWGVSLTDKRKKKETRK